MNIAKKLNLAKYCIDRLEYQLGKLSDESYDNLYKYVLNDEHDDDLEFDLEYCSTYFELNDIEIADCIKKDLADSES